MPGGSIVSSDIDRIREMFGILTDANWELSKEEPPIPVDEEKLRALHRGTLDLVGRDEVTYMIAKYQAWWDADRRVVLELSEESNRDKREVIRWRDWRPERRQLAAAVAIAATLLIAVLISVRPSGITQVADGRSTISISRDGSIRGLDKYPQEVREGIEHALVGNLPTPANTGYTGYSEPIAMRSDEKVEVALVAPVNTTIQTRQPVFSWKPVAGATGYQVSVQSQDGQQVVSPAIQVDKWKCDRELERGVNYDWTVRPIGVQAADKVLPGRFRVAAESEVARAKEAEEKFSDSPLSKFVVYSELGMFDLAEQELAKLAAKNPKSSVIEQMKKALSSRQQSPSEANARHNP